MPAETVFHMATLGSAESLGLADEVGSIERGKLADLVLVDVDRPDLTPLYDVYSHLVYAIKGGHVATVVVDGEVVVRDGDAVYVDERVLLREARAFRARILESLEAN